MDSKPPARGWSRSRRILVIVVAVIVVAVVIVAGYVLYVMSLGFGSCACSTPIVTLDVRGYISTADATVLSITQSDVLWEDVSILLTFIADTATWAPSSGDLSEPHNYLVTSDLGFRALGQIDVQCIVTDLVGNGRVNGGDLASFFTQAGKQFPEGIYTLNLMYEPTSESMGHASFTLPALA